MKPSPKKPSPSWPLVSFLGLFLFSFGLWVGCNGPRIVESPESGHPLDDLVVGQVGQREIRVKDILYKIDVQLPAMQDAQGVQDVKQKRQVLQQMIDQYCWVDLAEREGWDQDPKFLGILELSRKYILANHSAEKAVYDNLNFSDEQLREYYDENLDQFETAPRTQGWVILVATEGEAKSVYSRLASGEDFATLAGQLSIDQISNENGGRLGTVAMTAAVKGFPKDRQVNKVIMDLAEGQVSSPVRTSRGWAVFRSDSRVSSRTREFEEVREVIRENMYKKRANSDFSTMLATIKEDVGAQIDEAAYIRYGVSLLTAQEIMALGNSDREPENKISYYRGLIEKYPESALCSQAQFMLGFVQADQLDDFEQARSAFQLVVDRYPDSELVPSAKWMIENMDKSFDTDPAFHQIKKQIKSLNTGK